MAGNDDLGALARLNLTRILEGGYMVIKERLKFNPKNYKTLEMCSVKRKCWSLNCLLKIRVNNIGKSPNLGKHECEDIARCENSWRRF